MYIYGEAPVEEGVVGQGSSPKRKRRIGGRMRLHRRQTPWQVATGA